MHESLSSIPQGTHFCCIMDSSQELVSAMNLFAMVGKKKGAAVILVSPRDSSPDFSVEISAVSAFSSVTNDAASGFVRIDNPSCWSEQNRFDPQKLLSAIDAALLSVRENGYSLSHVLCDMRIIMNASCDQETYIAYERFLSELTSGSEAISACFFGRDAADASVLKWALLLHPVTWIQGKIQKNFYFSPALLSSGNSELPNEYTELDVLMACLHEHAPPIARNASLGDSLVAEAFQGFGDGLCIINEGCKILSANRMMENWFPERAPFIGRTFFEVICGKEIPCRSCAATRSLAVRVPATSVCVIRSKAHYMRMQICAHPILSSHESHKALLHIRDLTGADLPAEDHLRHMEGLSLLFSYAPVPMVLFDEDRKVVRANHSAARIFSCMTPAAAIGKRCGDLLGCINIKNYRQECGNTLACPRCKVNSALLQAVSDNQSVHGVEAIVETTRVRNGILTRKLHFMISAVPVEFRQGRRVLVCMEDITKRKQLQTRQALAERLESVARLTTGLAHDFKNRLFVIMGNAELLKGDPACDEESRKMLDEIISAANQVKTLVYKLLTYSRKRPMETVQTDLRRVVDEILPLLRRTVREDIDIQWFPSEIDCPVEVDPGQIENVLMDLAVNAQDAMPDGGTFVIETDVVDIDTEYASQKPGVVPGRYVRLTVTDTGCGIDPAIIDKIFEPYFTTKEEEKGTGLGLASVYGIVKKHRGNIWVYSEPQKGTSFKIYLPYLLGSDVSRTGEKKIERRAPEVRAGIHVLVVEDDPSVRRLTCAILAQHGYRVSEAVSDKDALAFAVKHPSAIDLVLTDIVLPGMNGVELYKKIKEYQPGAKVIYMSGYSEKALADEIDIHDQAFLHKPFSVSELMDLVCTVLE